MFDSIAPHGGVLKELLVDEAQAETLKAESLDFASTSLSQRQLCDLELLLNGGFSPLDGFMDQETYESVLDDMRLPGGLVWPMPIALDIPGKLAATLEPSMPLALRDNEGFMLGVLTVKDVWKPDKRREAEQVYGTASERHAGVRFLYEQVQEYYVGGVLEGLQLLTHFDYEELRHTPSELRHLFAKLGWRNVVAFHTSRPMHRLQRELTVRAAKEAQAHILLHPVVGMTKPGDLSYHARVRCYQAMERHYPHGLSTLSLLPLAMRMAGPREALWHALVRQNYGSTHFIVGNTHAYPPGNGSDAGAFYPAYAAQELIAAHQEQIDIRMVPFKELCYAPKRRQFAVREEVEAHKEPCKAISPKQLAHRLAHGEEIPDWFTYPGVLEALRKIHPPRSQQGITLFFTGLSGAGKSTIARIMYGKFIEEGSRPVTLLDGDIVRQHLSSELGFSKAHRDLNVRRIGFVASEITKNGGVAICAPIAPYAATRRAVREMIEEHGAFIEIHVATPLEVCEARDRKGLYAKARKGLIPEFTGISDPYEVPETPELSIDTSNLTPMQAAQDMFLYLLREGYLDTQDTAVQSIGEMRA
ncbi:MAG: bifunctional sulfate adenylyltransferase/adenylylsulfate kinase [Gammaproteobacteria bacterium]